jgi:hypothetical protein
MVVATNLPHRTLDPTRSINDNCGWEHVCTDLTTFHDYSDISDLTKTCSTQLGILKRSNPALFLKPISKAGVQDWGSTHIPGAPILCTEFGGLNIAPAQGSRHDNKEWGYITASDSADLLGRIESLVMGIVKGGQCCGFVYTQL